MRRNQRNKINQRNVLSQDRPDVAVYSQTKGYFINSVNLPNQRNIDVTASQDTKETFAQKVHQDMTYNIAIECRYDEEDAKYIATQCNNVDIDPDTTPFSTDPNKQGRHFNTFSNDTWENWGTINDSRWKHVLNCIEPLVKKNNQFEEEYRRHRINTDSSNVYKQVAQGLHALQDMFAHLPGFVYSLENIKTNPDRLLRLLQEFSTEDAFEIAKVCWKSIQNPKLSQNLGPELLRAKFHLHNSLADNINALSSRKGFVEHATAMYLRGDLESLKSLVEFAKGQLQEEIAQQNNTHSYKR